jgi:hypothetical protein
MMKLDYAYSSADGLNEKMQSVESVMEGIQVRLDKLKTRIDVVEKLRVNKLERYRIGLLAMTVICLLVVLGAYLLFR